jgi:hypothetical protein
MEKSFALDILITLIGFIISSLPLYFSAKLMGSKTSFVKTLFVAFITGIIISAIQIKFKVFGSIIAFFILIWIYHEVFRLKWLKAFFAWALQFIFVAMFYLIAYFFGFAVSGFATLY